MVMNCGGFSPTARTNKKCLLYKIVGIGALNGRIERTSRRSIVMNQLDKCMWNMCIEVFGGTKENLFQY